MKLLSLFILVSAITTLAANSYSQQTKFNISFRGATVREVLQKIEDSSEFIFLYSERSVDVDRKVDVNVTNQTVDVVLDQLFNGTKNYYEIKNRQIAILEKGSMEIPINSRNTGESEQQSRSVSGRVADSNGSPLPGVSVVVKGTTTGVITDIDGKYTMAKVPGNAILQFSFVGMKTQEMAVRDREVINITLIEETVGLEEVVAVGYGIVKKRDLTGSISQVKKETLVNKPNANPTALLAGHAAGVQVLSNSGMPGGETTIRIRGNNTLNTGNAPLYIIDGVPSGNITTINPNSIESIEVLKDASASAIYGARASNGVIIITTKRGEKGKPSFEFNSYYGLQQVARTIPMMNAEEQYQMTLKAIESYNRNNTIPSIIRPQTVADYNAGYDTNWQSEIFRTAPVQNYDLNIQKGTEDLKLAFGLNVFDQKGIIIGSGYKRMIGRFNFDLNISKQLKIGASVNFAREIRDKIPDGIGDAYSVVGNTMRKLPYEPVYESNGSYSFRERPNPVAQALEAHLFDYSTKGIGSTYLEYNIMNHLTFKTLFAADYLATNSESFRPSTIDGGAARPASFSGVEDLTWLNENTLTYSIQLKDVHKLTALAGYSLQENKSYSFSGAGQQGSSDAIYTLNTTAQKTNAYSYKTAWGLSSFFGRINYSYRDKYLVTFNLRQDGSSRFGENKQYALFPAGSFGWRVSEEPFLKNIPIISDLKIRGSIGKTGNQSISNYAAQGTYSQAKYAGSPGVYLGNFQNSKLTWETTTQYDAGIDLFLFNNRISFSADSYLKRTNGLLFYVPVPSTTGFSNAWQNLGNIENKGLEFAFNADIIKSDNFSWTSDFNISFNKNKVIKLPNHSPIISNYTQASFADYGAFFLTQEGHPMGQFYGLKWTGEIYPTNEAAQADVNSIVGVKPLGGTYKYNDISGPNGVADKQIDVTYDRQVIGDPNPDFIGGWNNTFKYKNFDLSCSMQFVYGNMLYNENRRTSMRGLVYNAYPKEMLNAWTTPGQITNVHKAYPVSDPADNQFSSAYLEDGSFLKIKDLTLGYNFSSKQLSKLKLSEFRVYLSGYNLYTFTKYKGFDPDVNAQASNVLTSGCDSGVFPQMKSVLLGINIKF